jgi:hypothetical protein
MFPVSGQPLVGGLESEKSAVELFSVIAGMEMPYVAGLMFVTFILRLELLPTFVGGKIAAEVLGIVISLIELFKASAK